MIIFFIIFLIINIEKEELCQYKIVNTTEALQNSSSEKFIVFNSKKDIKFIELTSSYFYIPISILRLLTINTIYLFFIKILLLTTHYNEIIKFILFKIKKFLKQPVRIFNLEVMISSQFLNIICIFYTAFTIEYT